MFSTKYFIPKGNKKGLYNLDNVYIEKGFSKMQAVILNLLL